MTHPDQPHPDQPRHDEHGRSAGGVRGAINDLLGRGERTDDDRRIEDRRLADERTGAQQDVDGTALDGAGYAPVAGDRHAGATAGAAAPQFDDRPDTIPGDARHHDVGPDGAGYEAQARSQAAPAAHAGPTGLDDTGQHAGAGVDPAMSRATSQDVGRHHDGPAGSDGPPSTDAGGPAGARTIDIGGPGSEAAEATTAPVRPNRDAVAATTPADHGTGSGTGSRGEDAEGRERLVSAERAESYGSRWDTVKGAFVDEPRQAVADADALVGELLDELQTLFTEQRRGIEHGLNNDETSTEDMRLALRRYRSFFDRLLSI